jgi:tRNA(Ile)-lysidine synthase
MLCEFEKKVLDYITAQRLFVAEENVLLAVSGGADSTALLHCLYSLKAEGKIKAHFICVHLNHQLRAAESDKDEKFVIKQARNLGIEVLTKRLNVRTFAKSNKLSIETAARQLRIYALLEIARRSNCKFVATGHQKNDNAETVLQRLLRGTAYRGLGGIWPSRDFADIKFIRPLLDVTREQITAYLKERRLSWRLDATNEQCIYHRNFVRHQLIPEIQKDCTGSIVEQLSKLSAAAQKFHHHIHDRAQSIWPKLTTVTSLAVKLDINSFLLEPEPVQVELIRLSLTAIGSGERDFTQEHYMRIIRLCRQKTNDKLIELPNSFKAHRQYQFLTFTSPAQQEQRKLSDKTVELNVPGKTKFADYVIEATVTDFDAAAFEKFKTQKNSFVEWFDFDKLSLPLTIRPRRPGDRFIPLGLNTEKKVGQFLTDAKVPQNLRKTVLVIADTEKIIWLCPIRISNNTRITDKTKTVLQLRID